MASCQPQYQSSIKPEAAQPGPRPEHAFPFEAVLFDGSRTKVGTLWVGHTTLSQAVNVFPATPPGDPYHTNAPRHAAEKSPKFITYDGKELAPHPKTVYNPWGAMYQLWFDKDQVLRVIVDAMPSEYDEPLSNMAEAFSGLHRVAPVALDMGHRTVNMQTRLNPCVVLSVWGSADD